MDKIIEMNYNGKCEVTLRSVVRSESLRPFTQLDEQTHNIFSKAHLAAVAGVRRDDNKKSKNAR